MASKCATLLRGVLPLLLAAGASSAFATDAPRQLNWADLVPKNVVAAPAKAKSFFGGSTPMPDGGPPPPPLPEGKFMSVKRRQPGSDRPPAVVPELDGQNVSIGGYVVPLDFDCDDGEGVPARAVRRRLHPRAAAAGQPDHLRQGG